jgi:hypothetical protein
MPVPKMGKHASAAGVKSKRNLRGVYLRTPLERYIIFFSIKYKEHSRRINMLSNIKDKGREGSGPPPHGFFAYF